jgi:hypothetical protein
MAVFVLLTRLVGSALLLACATLVLCPHPARAENNERDMGCSPTLANPCGSAPDIDDRPNRREYDPPAPDPGQIALQSAVAGYKTLVSQLPPGVLDPSDWVRLPLGTEPEFLSTANRLHEVLVDKAQGNRSRVIRLTGELEAMNHKMATYPGLIEANRAEIARLEAERDGAAAALKEDLEHLDLVERASQRLEARASRYQQDANAAKQSIMGWFAVMLPPSVAKSVVPQPYGPLDWVASVEERHRDSAKQPPSIIPAAAVGSPFSGFEKPADPVQLTGTPESVLAQLKADAAELTSAMKENTWELSANVEALRPASEKLEQDLKETATAKDNVQREAQSLDDQRQAAAWKLLIANDNLKAAEETFVYRAAEAWIWENAKTEATQRVKDEVRRLVAAKWIGPAFHDVTDEEMRTFFSAGKHNIFGLADKVLSSGDGLYEVVQSIQTLQTRGEGYMQEAVRVASLGTPQQIAEFTDAMFTELGDDGKELVKANFGALDVPEPYKSLAAKYFIKQTAD